MSVEIKLVFLLIKKLHDLNMVYHSMRVLKIIMREIFQIMNILCVSKIQDSNFQKKISFTELSEIFKSRFIYFLQ